LNFKSNHFVVRWEPRIIKEEKKFSGGVEWVGNSEIIS
jgi:hypothetical protein